MIVLSSKNVMDFMLYGVIDGEEFGLTLIQNMYVTWSIVKSSTSKPPVSFFVRE